MTKAVDRANQLHQLSTEVRALAFDLAAARTSLPIDALGVARAAQALQGHIDAAIADPAGYLTTAVGKKPGPDEPQRIKSWETAVRGIETWRHEHGIVPADGAKQEAKTALGRAIYRIEPGVADSLRLTKLENSFADHLKSPDVHQTRALRR
jgi:hypothetical protein